MTAPVEFTARYATSVDDLASAWAFVMSHIDQVGTDPSVTITPRWSISVDAAEDAEWPRTFEVTVSGMVHVCEAKP